MDTTEATTAEQRATPPTGTLHIQRDFYARLIDEREGFEADADILERRRDELIADLEAAVRERDEWRVTARQRTNDAMGEYDTRCAMQRERDEAKRLLVFADEALHRLVPPDWKKELDDWAIASISDSLREVTAFLAKQVPTPAEDGGASA